MHQASVGFQCPDCARSGAQKVVRAPQLRGGGATATVTNALIAINVAVYVYGLSGGDRLLDDGGLYGYAVANGEWYRIITSGFLHASLIHVGFNCFVLYQLGMLMEPVLGKLRFGLVYGFSLLSGALGVLLLDPDALTVGASGAVFGIMGAAVAAMRSRGINPFQTGLGGTIVLNLLITFAVPNISIGGHIGGLIGGFLATWLLLDVGPKAVQDDRVLDAIVVVAGLAVAGACLAVA